MIDTAKSKLGLFIENYETIKHTFKMENSYYYPVGALFFTGKNELAQADKLKAAVEIIKAKTGVFSYIRSDMRLITASHLSLSENPEATLDRIINTYERLKQEFSSSSYLVNAALFLADEKEIDLDSVCVRARRIYGMMKQEHRFLTGQEDSGSAVMLALSEFDDLTVIDRCEKCYSILRDEKVMHDTAQSLSHVLALADGDCELLARRTLALFEQFKCAKRRYSSSYELPTLGLLAQVPGDVCEIVKKVIELDDLLKAHKGFGNFFGIGQSQRLMYSALIHSFEYSTDFAGREITALNAAISLVVAQQSATTAAIAASAAASSST